MAKIKPIASQKPLRKIIHAENFSEAEKEGIINLYNAMVPGNDTRAIDVKLIKEQGFPKFEETIGKEAFAKVKRYFGIEGLANAKGVRKNEIEGFIAKMKTIENAMGYIYGYRELIEQVAKKMLNAPEGMTALEKAKLIRMFFVIFAGNEFFLEDYTEIILPTGEKKTVANESKGLANNKLLIAPEELFALNEMKTSHEEGYYYDMLVQPFKRLYDECQETGKLKTELAEVLRFGELRYDSESECFKSINKCMPGVTFGKLRQLKQRIHEVRGVFTQELFCNKSMITKLIDVANLYLVYKTLAMTEWKQPEKESKMKFRTMSGSRFINVEQTCYEIVEGFLVAGELEAALWMDLFEYLSEAEVKIWARYNGDGEPLPEPELYNMGALSAALKFAMDKQWISIYTMVSTDLRVARILLNLEGAEEKFLAYKRYEMDFAALEASLAINVEFEKNVLQIDKNEEVEILQEADESNAEDFEEQQLAEVGEDSVSAEEDTLIMSVIKFALDNGYAEAEDEIDINLVRCVVIPGNEDTIKKFTDGLIDESEFKKRIGMTEEFSEAYFNTAKIDVKKVEEKLQAIKRSTKEGLVRRNKLLIRLYCFVVKNGVKCGPKNKPAKRNKGLRPEILESLIEIE